MGVGDGIGLLLKIQGDPTSAVEALKVTSAAAKTEVNKTLAEFQRLNAYKPDFKSATDVLIAESQKAISAFDKQISSANRSYQSFSSSVSVAEKEAGSLANTFISTYGSTLALTGAIGGAGAALIALGKYATDAAAQLWDLHQKTGFSVESLSTLKNLAETSGVEFQSLSAGLGIFEKNMGAAHDPTSKQSELFKKLKVDINDNEKALRDAFTALDRMKDGEEQTSAAMALFGRSGKEMIGIIKESNGNLDVAMEKFRDLGTLISTEDAQAADKFQDELQATGQAALALAKDIGTTLIPVFKALLFVVEQVIQSLRFYVEVLKFALSSHPVLDAAEQMQATAASLQAGPFVASAGIVGQNMTRAGTPLPNQVLGGGAEIAAVTPAMQRMWAELNKKTGGKKGRTPRDDEGSPDIQALDEANRAIVEKMRAANDEIKAEYDKGEKDRDDYYDEARLRLHSATLDELTNIESQKTIAATRIKDQTKLNHELAKLEDAATKIKNAETKEKRRLDAEQEKDALDEKIGFLERANASQKFYENKQLENTKDALDRGLAYEGDVEQLRFENQQAQLDREKEILEEKRKAYGEYAEGYKALTDQLEMIDAERLRSEELHARKMNDILINIGQGDREKASDAMLKSGGGDDFGNTTAGLIDQMNKDLGKPPPMIDAMGDAIKGLKATAIDAFKGMGQAFGSLVGQWASGANIGKNAFRTIVSSALAGVAALAATQAVYELALGFAALTPWGAAIYGPAPMHFKAAALLGSIAVVSALAGRALAPVSNEAGAAAGGVGTSGSSATPTQPRNVEINRPTDAHSRLAATVDRLVAVVGSLAAVPASHVLIKGSQDPAGANAIGDAFIQQYQRRPGDVRQVIVNGGILADA